MNAFVNVQKRGVELPEGCKDLIDVLQNPWVRPTGKLQTFPEKESSRCGFVAGKLKDLTFQVSQLFTLAIKPQVLVIFGVHSGMVLYRQDGILSVRFSLTSMEPACEQTIRAIFNSANLHPTEDSITGTTRALKYPLPNILSDATNFINVLLRKGYGLNDEARLDFRYAEL